MVPNINILTKNELRYGLKDEIPKLSGSVSSVRSIRERTINVAGARMYNSMPKVIREYAGDLKGFKILLDQYLSEIPDCPIIDGYISHNLDEKSKPSNSLIHWNNNLNNINWTPGALMDKAGLVP